MEGTAEVPFVGLATLIQMKNSNTSLIVMQKTERLIIMLCLPFSRWSQRTKPPISPNITLLENWWRISIKNPLGIILLHHPLGELKTLWWPKQVRSNNRQLLPILLSPSLRLLSITDNQSLRIKPTVQFKMIFRERHLLWLSENLLSLLRSLTGLSLNIGNSISLSMEFWYQEKELMIQGTQ